MNKEKLIEMGCTEDIAAEIEKCFLEQQKKYSGEIAELKINNAVDTAIAVSGARNAKAVRSLLDFSIISLGENDKAMGIDEQIAQLRSTDGYLFADSPEKPVFTGFQPTNSADGISANANNMSYSQLSAYMGQNPDFKLN